MQLVDVPVFYPTNLGPLQLGHTIGDYGGYRVVCPQTIFGRPTRPVIQCRKLELASQTSRFEAEPHDVLAKPLLLV